MFNNNFDYIEELVTGENDIGEILENKPERFAVTQKRAVPVDDRVFKQSRVDSMLWAYRDIGYLYANVNPLGETYNRDFTRLVEFQEESYHKLSLEEFGLSEADLETEFFGGKFIGDGMLPLREILARFTATYCSSVGAEFLHIQNKNIREWLIERMESTRNVTRFSPEQKRIILSDLIKSEELENILHRTFLGQTRFSIQGADVVIPALHFLVDSARRFNIEEIVMGTSHRGRLSILNAILEQSPEEIFYRFEENFVPGMLGGSGDVRYHIGYCTRHVNEDGTSVNITLLPNSSHLESVDAVVEGDVRGLQDLRNDAERKRIIPVLLHGDASFSAQGVVAETFNLSQLEGYTTGGTLHIVINNQIGFTTSMVEGRSGLNPTDVAKMMPVPIFHVNGDDPEAMLHIMQLALEYRQKFHRDVVVDIYSYRRYGHNEGDEPSFTHPRMYALIKDHESTLSLYAKKCLKEALITEDEIKEMRDRYKQALASALKEERAKKGEIKGPTPESGGIEEKEIVTASPEPLLLEIAQKITTAPPDFTLHSRLKRIIEGNYKKFREEKRVDWAMAETLAFGTLLLDGVPVRLSGQDSVRGTFSQRHLVWWETEKGARYHYVPLANLTKDQARLSAYDSPLSEYSALAFEYGYAISRPDSLVIWEAQYGDFANGSQVVIDCYIVSGKSKWNIENGLVLLLPHGYEGMGAEHSSGHLERFLQLCSEDNIRVCNVTTPAQYFHLLRRQKKNRNQRPLVIMTPKSLLRHPRSVSTLNELSKGGFRRILDDVSSEDIRRLLFCSGKIYYDLINEFKEEHRVTTGIVRVEQLYPFPKKEIEGILDKYRKVKSLYWVQEEPRNRGAWRYMQEQFEHYFPESHLLYIGREASASPATGSLKKHNEEQQTIVARAIKDYDKN
ncbi:MAG: 2-oxoglutarate dehydrogenase E1 component [Spirochaetes bacterium RBG_16_49_21]|nr:MAG: 2-oxoglutarate dehydrogenase E1 component [Spirochaetes bacterium RBG_16_49_21]